MAIKVIGKEGSVLKKIMQKSGARIYFEKKKNEREDRICKIAGSEVSISKAKAMIEDIRNRKSEVWTFNRLHHTEAFWCLCSRQLKNIVTKEEIAHNEQFLFCHNVFNSI